MNFNSDKVREMGDYEYYIDYNCYGMWAVRRKGIRDTEPLDHFQTVMGVINYIQQQMKDEE